MKKSRRNSGFSLIELLCALLILVILVIGIGVSMDAGVGIYRDATFEAESATLAGILNTSLGDILRYSVDVRETTAEEKLEHGSDVEFVFTSLDYGIQDAYFYVPPHESGKNMGPLQLKNTRNPNVVELVNTGAYPDLVITDFKITYTERYNPGIAGGYFEISYTIYSESDSTKTREVETIVRALNAPMVYKENPAETG
jgi:prepilin-type N-terminal cleavage/methylation domain-containing protein